MNAPPPSPHTPAHCSPLPPLANFFHRVPILQPPQPPQPRNQSQSLRSSRLMQLSLCM